jgi:hypothetical protein
MEQHGDEVHITQEEASGGSKPNIVRYVLGISLALAIGAMSAIWIFGAANAPQGSHTAAISNQAPPVNASGQ